MNFVMQICTVDKYQPVLAGAFGISTARTSKMVETIVAYSQQLTFI